MSQNQGAPLILRSPVIIAAGTLGQDGYGEGFPPDLELHRLGAVIPKTLTPRPRTGNPWPRRWPGSYRQAQREHAPAYLNSIGLENPGLAAALPEIPSWAERWQTSVIISIAGETESELAQMAGKLDRTPGISGIEE